MSQYAMPVLIINLGGEMLYILEQRLQAQNIPPDKSRRVLQDVVRTMFSEKFITELMKPQQIYTQSSTRQIFNRLAHSSIMRLNSSSMDKLYDLMTMGFKYQIVVCTQASDLFQVTVNHLDVLRNLIGPADPVAKLITKTIQGITKMYENWGLAEWMSLRQLLCNFLQDKRVKVSLFLQDGLQNADGTIHVSHKGPIVRGGEIPGTIRYFVDGAMNYEEQVPLSNSEGALLPQQQQIGGDGRLGANLYSKDRVKKTNTNVLEEDKSPSRARREKSAQEVAKAELNLLASLLGTPQQADQFVINLFPDTSLVSNASVKEVELQAQTVTFDAEDLDARTKRIQDAIGDFSIDEHDNDQDDNGGDNLLDLLDSADQDGDKDQ